MEKKQLLQTLEALHEELQGVSAVDTDTLALLATVIKDIHRLVQPSDSVTSQTVTSQTVTSQTDATQEVEDPTQEVENLTAQVQDLMLKFKTDHPQLTRALNQVSSALANLGI